MAFVVSITCLKSRNWCKSGAILVQGFRAKLGQGIASPPLVHFGGLYLPKPLSESVRREKCVYDVQVLAC